MAPTSSPARSACSSRRGTAPRSASRRRSSAGTRARARRSGEQAEFDQPEFAAKGADGEPVIAVDAHVRLAHPDVNDGARLLRRGYNFVDGSDGLGRLDAGLFFIAYQRDPRRQFVPVQTRLARQDALNEYIRHVSSGLFACPPGIRAADDYWGRALFGVDSTHLNAVFLGYFGRKSARSSFTICNTGTSERPFRCANGQATVRITGQLRISTSSMQVAPRVVSFRHHNAARLAHGRARDRGLHRGQGCRF